jgi:hypothetical protein
MVFASAASADILAQRDFTFSIEQASLNVPACLPTSRNMVWDNENEDWIFVGGFELAPSRDAGFDRLNAIAFDGNQLVVVGHYGRIKTSSDGFNWTNRASGTSDNLLSVATDGSRWVAVGQNRNILTSTDGENWTVVTTGNFVHYNSVYHHNGKWVIVGGSANILTSTDGLNWQQVNNSSGPNFLSVTHSGNQWIASASNIVGQPTIYRATNPDSWANWSGVDPSSGTTILNSITHGSGRYVAAGDGGVITSSTNSTSWANATTESIASNVFNSVHHSDGIWMAAGNGGWMEVSSNGLNWSYINSDISQRIVGSVYAGNKWIVVGDSNGIWTHVCS